MKKWVMLAVFLMPMSVSNADMQSELQSWMSGDEFVNVNQPAAYQSQAAGYGVSFGGLKYRTTSIPVGGFASFRKPKLSSGCGGIDLDLGGFNFVNKDQIVQQLRAIASNAKGMVFQMAIDTVSSMLGNNMKAFKNVADFLNKGQMDSCAAASKMMSGITDVVSPDIARNKCISQAIDERNLSYDQALRECGPQGARAGIIGDTTTQNRDSWKKGNLAWAILMQDDYFKNNKENALLLMNITGTLIARDSIAGLETNTTDTNEQVVIKDYIQPWFISNTDSGANCDDSQIKKGVGSVCYSKNVNRLLELLVNGKTTDGGMLNVFRCKDNNMVSDENGCPDVERDANGKPVYAALALAPDEAIKPKMSKLLKGIQVQMLLPNGSLTDEQKNFIGEMDGAIYHYMLASSTLLRSANVEDSNLDAYLTLMAQRKVGERFAKITSNIRDLMTAGKYSPDNKEDKQLYIKNLEKTIVAFGEIANTAKEGMIAMQQMQNMANLYEKALVSSMGAKMLSRVKFGG